MQINKDYLPALKSRNRYLIMMGGAGSGKSISAAQKILLRCKHERGHRFLVIRKVATTLKPSVWQTFKDLIFKNNLEKEFVYFIADRKIKHLPSGNEILFMGLDDPEKIKSIAGITGVWIEEATELSSLDFNQLDLRLRGETVNYKQIMLTFNPIDEFHWLKNDFFDNTVNDCFILKTTYVNNKFLDDEYIRLLTERMRSNENLYRIYVQGEWGSASMGNEFYSKFKFSKHVHKIEYDENLPIHLSFDINAIPYITCLVAQIRDKEISVLEEILLEHPNSTSWKIAKEIERKYRHHNAGMFIYGDPNGRKRDTRQEGVEIKASNDYTIIFKELDRFHPTDRILRKAPRVKMRGDFINAILENNFNEINIKISDLCKKLIQDLTYIKMRADGDGKLKEMVRDENSGVSYEKYGHTSDALDYLLVQVLKDDFYLFEHGKPKQVQSITFKR